MKCFDSLHPERFLFQPMKEQNVILNYQCITTKDVILKFQGVPESWHHLIALTYAHFYVSIKKMKTCSLASFTLRRKCLECPRSYVLPLTLILIAFPNMLSAHSKRANWGTPRSFISDKSVYSEPDGTVLWRAGDHVYVSPGVSDFQLSAVH